MAEKKLNPLSLTEKFVQNLEPRQKKKLVTSSIKIADEEFSQDFIPVKDFQAGMIFMNDGSIVKILEIIPLNYFEKDPSEKDMIADSFGNNFKVFPLFGHIKMMNAKVDLRNLERNIREATKNETNPNFLKRVEDYIQNNRHLQRNSSVRKRFFFIFEYEGDEKGKKSDDINDIYISMLQVQNEIANSFRAMGHVVIQADIDNMPLVNILYDYYNPKSMNTSPLSDRIEHLDGIRSHLQHTGLDVTPSAADYIAPRGIRMGRWNFMVMDGVYHMFFCLSDDSYPSNTCAGWLTIISDLMPDCDIDILYKKNTMGANEFLLDRYSMFNKGLALSAGNQDKKRKLVNKSQNASYLKSLLDNQQEELYDVCTIVTLRANSYKELLNKRYSFVKNMRKKGFHFDESFMQTQELFKMVMPLNYVNDEIFRSCSRNMTNSSLASLYFFSSFEMFDEKGDVLGLTAKNPSTIFSINNFDTKLFPNPHYFFIATSGAGKTYTELMLSNRMRMRGIRTMFILPLKGHEYKDAVESMGGSFISLRPGGKACLNIMELRPEGHVRVEEIDDSEIKKELDEMPSLVARQTINVITWIRMLMGDDRLTVDEVSELDTCIRKVYSRFGFSDDNDSIWADAAKKTLKPMPIIGDLYEEVKANPKLLRVLSVLKPWVYGNCSNMNGQTNVDLSNSSIAFDINEDYIGEDLLPAFMLIAYIVCYNIAKADEYEMCAIFLDEIWKMLAIPACAKQIQKMIKILRGYATCLVAATQDIEDCTKNEWGRALITNSAIKVFLRVTKEEIRFLGDSIDLSPENKNLITKLPKGMGFVCFNSERILVNFKSSLLEEELYTTDINKKKEIRQHRLNHS